MRRLESILKGQLVHGGGWGRGGVGKRGEGRELGGESQNDIQMQNPLKANQSGIYK